MYTQNKHHLSQLISSLSKGEKRSFKLYCNRQTQERDSAKFLQLFNFLNQHPDATDEACCKAIPALKRTQLPNLKAHLYKQILTSLRLHYLNHMPILEIREQLDYAQVLYHRGLHSASLKLIEKAKAQAEKANAQLLLLEIMELEKRIESLFLTDSFKSRAEELVRDSSRLSMRVEKGVVYSNLFLELYGIFTKVGVVRNEDDYREIKRLFESKLPDSSSFEPGFHEKLMLYNTHVWYNLIVQDFLNGYRYAQRWVDLFDQYPEMISYEPEMYLKGIHNLLLALFNIRNYPKYAEVLQVMQDLPFKEFTGDNIRVQYYLYWYTAKINLHYLEGSFTKGLATMPEIDNFIAAYSHILDVHRVMVLHYKMACLYFGAGDNKTAIRYLNLVIHSGEQAWREDIQSFARILNLIAHYELGNDILVEYQIKSVYRFLLKMNELNGVQQEIFRFLRQLPLESHTQQIRVFTELKQNLLKLSEERFEKRPFLYLDIISWLEAKIEGISVEEAVQRKFKHEQQTGERLYFPVKKR